MLQIRRVFRYYTPNKYSLSKKYAHHLFFLFFPFRSEKELLGEHLSTYQGKLAEPCVMDLLMKTNKSLSLMQLWLTRHMKISIQNFNNQDADSQIENHVQNDETGEPIYSEDSDPTEQNSQIHESNLALADFIPKIAADDKVAANIRSLNKKQHIVFDVLHQWPRNYVKNFSSKKFFRLTQSKYFCLVVEAQGSLT